MTATANPIVILGGNDTSFQLQQRIQNRSPDTPLCMVQDSAYGYCPVSFYPQLLAGTMSIQDVMSQTGVFRSRRTEYLRSPDNQRLKQAVVINTNPDPHHLSVLHLPDGRRRNIPLYRADDVLIAREGLAQHGCLLVQGSSLQAALYAAAAARAGYETWLEAGPDLIHRGFDADTNALIQRHLQQAGVLLKAPGATCPPATPVLHTPFSSRNAAVSRARQHLKQQLQQLPVAHYELQDGGDWYQLPEQACEQLLQRIRQDSAITQQTAPATLSRLWHNKPALPHRFSINNLAVHYAGLLQPEQAEDCITMSVPECGIYRKIILAGNRIAGFLLAGDVRGSDILADMMLTHRNINDCRDELIFIGH